MPGVKPVGTVTVSAAVGSLPSGASPLAVAVLVTWPAATSAAVVTWFTGPQLAESPGFKLLGAQAIAPPSSGSSTCTLVSGTLPVLVTVKLYSIGSPSA